MIRRNNPVTVKFLNNSSSTGTGFCFAGASWNIRNPLNKDADVHVVKIETEFKKVHYLSILGFGGSGGGHDHEGGKEEDVLRIHPKFAQSLGLRDGEGVTLMEEGVLMIPRIKRANVSCVSRDDWEILESNTDQITSNLLNQIRVIYPNLTFPFWVTRTLVIYLKVDSLDPPGTEVGLLMENTEIIVLTMMKMNINKEPNLMNISKKMRKFRVHPIPNLQEQPSTFQALLNNPRNGFIMKNQFFNETDDDDSSLIVEVISSSKNPIKVKVFLISESSSLNLIFQETNPPCIYLHEGLINKGSLEVKSYVWVKPVEDQEDLEELDPKLGEPKTTTSKDHLPQHQDPCDCDDKKNTPPKGFPTPDLLQECLEFIHSSLSLGGVAQHNLVGLGNGCLLIEGKSGSGKTTLCHALSKLVEGPPFFLHTHLIPCSKFKGKKPEIMEKELRDVLERGVELRPSLLFLDDLDVITPALKDEGVGNNPQEAFLGFVTCERIRETLLSLCKDQQIYILATVTLITGGGSLLSPYWKSRGGFHFFHKTVGVNPLSHNVKLEIFNSYLAQHNYKFHEKDFMKILKKSMIPEQCATPRFISNISKKFMVSLNNEEGDEYPDPSVILEGIIDQELKLMEMEDREGINMKRRGHVPPPVIKWEDVAGLHEIKGELIKILKWPIKYKEIFDSAPIRLPSGILFYGYPGTGKTLMGLALPSLIRGVKFIHIKGPELLSKYIGGSEQSVQNVFKRARNSAPCIIFFDEFDSLVPRRGHDSTGVTDRVVNQFLTEMDGIEGGLGQGVWLVGATSRPDLIDPAILRPGRLDKHLFFNLPTEEEIKELLLKVGAKVSLNYGSDNEVTSLVERIKGFSGADITALITTARMGVIEGYIQGMKINPDNDDDGKCENVPKKNLDLEPSDIPDVTIQDILASLPSFRPSLQGQELGRFTQIYNSFSSSSKEESLDGIPRAQAAGKRATLA